MEKISKELVEKGGISKHLNNYYLLGGILVVVLIILAFFLFYSPFEDLITVSRCGDGTFEDYCSLKKPFFCKDLVLSEDASSCGCPDSFRFDNGSCVTNYVVSEEPKTLDYSVFGVSGEILMDFYPNVSNYLSDLPRTRIYLKGETPRRDDFKLDKINDPIQRDFLMPLVVRVQNYAPNSKDDQARIAISIVQNIPYNESEFVQVFGFESGLRLSRYPYQVIGESRGSCEGKSELLAFMLREMGFGVALFYYAPENHEALGIKCPIEESYMETGYCFVETTMPSPISYSEGKYLGIGGSGKLLSEPEILLISGGISLGEDLEEYEDSKTLGRLVEKIDNTGKLNLIDKKKMDDLRLKYGLIY